MTPDEFRQSGHRLVDWVADYMASVEQYPVCSQVRPGEIRSQLPPSPPELGQSFDEVLADVERIVMPGITHWQSPNFFAFFPANHSGPSVLGELLSAGLGVQGMLWLTSPACTELETHMMDWLVEMLALPDHFLSSSDGGGVIQDTASSSSLCALLAAREKATGFESNRRGVTDRLAAYTSEQAHSSIEKAMMISGLGSEQLRCIATDDQFRMRPDSLAEAIRADLAEGIRPFFVAATVGTTSAGAIDPLPAIGDVCRGHDLWLHVDAAMAGSAAVCPEFRFVHEGLEKADSYCFNPHKWMFTNFDCNCFWIKDRSALIKTLSILPEYLKNKASESGAVLDYRDWQIPLGRRFRALKLWFVIRMFGIREIQRLIRRHVEMAQEFARWVDEHEDFELVHAPRLNLVCFRRCGDDDCNRELLERLNDSGRVFLTHTKLAGRFTLRMSIGQLYTEPRHVENAWKLICELAARR